MNLILCEYLQKERHKKFILYICENNENKRLNKRKKKLHLGKNYLTSDKKEKIKNNALKLLLVSLLVKMLRNGMDILFGQVFFFSTPITEKK